MPTSSSRNLMRLLVAAFLLFLGSGTNGSTRISVHRHPSSHPGIGAANHSALLPARYVANPKGADTALPQLLASEASPHDRRAQSAPKPTRDCLSLCSYERTPAEAARPPPFQP